MASYLRIEAEIEKKINRQDRRKRKKMKVSGKGVFQLKKLLNKKAASAQKNQRQS